MFMNLCIARPKCCFILCTSAVWQLWLNEYVMLCYVVDVPFVRFVRFPAVRSRICLCWSRPRNSSNRFTRLTADIKQKGLITARRYAIAQYMLSTHRVSVRLSVTRHRTVSKRLDAAFRHGGFLPHILYCVRGNSGNSKNNNTSLWNFVQK